MARQPISKYFPQNFGNQFLGQAEVNADDPLPGAGELYSGIGFYQDAQLIDAEILAIATTPIEVVAAPGAGRGIVVTAAYFFLFVGLGAYDDAAADGDLDLIYTGGADASAGLALEADTFIDAAASRGTFKMGASDILIPTEVLVTENVGISLSNDGAEFTTVGNDTSTNTLSVRVYYDIVDLAAFGA